MNNIPENEKLVEHVLEDETVTDNSTVFSAPQEHSKKAEDFKKKKLLPVVLVAILVVAILLGSTFAVIKFIPEKTDGDETSTPTIEDIEVLNLNSNDFKTVNISNSNGIFKLFSTKDKSDNDEDVAASWYIEGYAQGLLDPSSVGYIAESLAKISASREVTKRTASDCGLDKPLIKADITDNNGKSFSISLGDESPDKSGYYLKLSNSDKIYVVNPDLMETLNFTDVSIADTSILPAFDITDISSDYKGDDGLLASCDKLTLTGKNFSEPLVIEPNRDKTVAVYAAFNITSPTKRAAENVDGVFEIFKSGVTVSGAYSLNKKPTALSEFGLDKPDLTARMEIEGKSHTFKFKLQKDGSYAAVCDGVELIKKVEADAIPFINKKTSDYYSDWVCLNGIDNLKSFTVKLNGETHVFSIKANPAEDSEQLYFINYNGKELKSGDFQEFYKSCIALTCSDFTTDKVTAKPTFTYIFTYNDDIGGSQTVEFTKFSETKYQYSIDGEAMGKVTASSLRNIENALKNLIKE